LNTCGGTGRRDTNAGEYLQSVKDALRAPANLGAAIGYYRAAYTAPRSGLRRGGRRGDRYGAQLTLSFHGERDGCVGVEAAANAGPSLSPGSKVDVVTGVGHFLHLERPDVVHNLIVDWVSLREPARGATRIREQPGYRLLPLAGRHACSRSNQLSGTGDNSPPLGGRQARERERTFSTAVSTARAGYSRIA
jgi:hypothetical protein